MVSVVRLPATRWGAFFGHLLLSLIILLVLSALIALVMFPGALFSLAGGVDGIKIIAGVDMVLGPLLTLIIYNRTKPTRELLRDLSIIFAIQVLALGAGMYVVHQSRPAAVVYSFDQFHTTKLSEFKEEGQAPEDLRWLRPAYYNLQLPADDDEARSQMVEFEFSGQPIRLMVDKFEPLSKTPDELAAQLRVGSLKTESMDDECLVREVSTAFDAADICFDPNTHRMRRAVSTNAAVQ